MYKKTYHHLSGHTLYHAYKCMCTHVSPVIAVAYFAGTVTFFFPAYKGLQSEDLLPSRGVAGSGFRPLPNIPHCCLP